VDLLKAGKYPEASDLMAEDLRFLSPRYKFRNREEWLGDFPRFTGGGGNEKPMSEKGYTENRRVYNKH
jgi:hypothetical protein